MIFPKYCISAVSLRPQQPNSRSLWNCRLRKYTSLNLKKQTDWCHRLNQSPASPWLRKELDDNSDWIDLKTLENAQHDLKWGEVQTLYDHRHMQFFFPCCLYSLYYFPLWNDCVVRTHSDCEKRKKNKFLYLLKFLPCSMWKPLLAVYNKQRGLQLFLLMLPILMGLTWMWIIKQIFHCLPRHSQG